MIHFYGGLFSLISCVIVILVNAYFLCKNKSHGTHYEIQIYLWLLVAVAYCGDAVSNMLNKYDELWQVWTRTWT